MELSHVILVLAQVSGVLFVIASMLAMGLALTVSNILASVSNVRVMLLGLAVNLVVVPGLAQGGSQRGHVSELS